MHRINAKQNASEASGGVVVVRCHNYDSMQNCQLYAAILVVVVIRDNDQWHTHTHTQAAAIMSLNEMLRTACSNELCRMRKMRTGHFLLLLLSTTLSECQPSACNRYEPPRQAQESDREREQSATTADS